MFISFSLIVVSIFAYFVFGLNYGIDFKGETLLMVKNDQPVPISNYREVLNDLDIGDVSVTEISDPASEISKGILGIQKNIILIRIEQTHNQNTVQNKIIIAVKTKLSASFPDVVFLQTDSVGAKVSKELVRTGILAVVWLWLQFYSISG